MTLIIGFLLGVFVGAIAQKEFHWFDKFANFISKF
jgi:ABC-type dipeptide/oligopeptide/nickel transport system permease component